MRMTYVDNPNNLYKKVQLTLYRESYRIIWFEHLNGTDHSNPF